MPEQSPMLTLVERLQPQRCAVLVIDVQNDFCSPDGLTAKAGRSVDHSNRMLPALTAFIDLARTQHVPVLFVQTISTPFTESTAWRYRASEKARGGNCHVGTWGAEFYVVAPRSDEAVVVKHRNNAFHNTRLESILHTFRTETVILTGVATNISVETTARDAVQRDFHVVLVEDCVAAYDAVSQEATFANIRQSFGFVATSLTIGDAWSSNGTD